MKLSITLEVYSLYLLEYMNVGNVLLTICNKRIKLEFWSGTKIEVWFNECVSAVYGTIKAHGKINGIVSKCFSIELFKYIKYDSALNCLNIYCLNVFMDNT